VKPRKGPPAITPTAAAAPVVRSIVISPCCADRHDGEARLSLAVMSKPADVGDVAPSGPTGTSVPVVGRILDVELIGVESMA
jgi:hypothetical protein